MSTRSSRRQVPCVVLADQTTCGLVCDHGENSHVVLLSPSNQEKLDRGEDLRNLVTDKIALVDLLFWASGETTPSPQAKSLLRQYLAAMR